MCIRDSIIRADALYKIERLFSFDDKFTHVGDIKHANALAPVSYTHLRAHETVLDLVCRLLLEKKKS